MAILTPQPLTTQGIEPTFHGASAGGDSFLNDGNTYIHIKNGHSGPQTVTLTSIDSARTTTLGEFPLADLEIVVPDDEERIAGPFPQTRFNDANGRVSMTYSGVTALTVAVIRQGRKFI